MKRDLDLIRNLLLRIEADDVDCSEDETLDIHTDNAANFVTGYSAKDVLIHLDLLLEAGLIDAQDAGGIYCISRLSWKGYDYLDAVRDDKVWKKTKDVAAKAGAFSVEAVRTIAVDIVTSTATALIKQAAGL